jgi:hypothetical protein
MLPLALLLLFMPPPLEPLGPFETLPFIIPFIIIPLLLTPCLDFRVRRFPFELVETPSPVALPPVTRRSSRTAVKALGLCAVIMVKEMRNLLVLLKVVVVSVRLILFR